jgi:hypothetical protein
MTLSALETKVQEYTKTAVSQLKSQEAMEHCRHRPDGVPFSVESPEPGYHPGWPAYSQRAASAS